jgi:hypothetical protein
MIDKIGAVYTTLGLCHYFSFVFSFFLGFRVSGCFSFRLLLSFLGTAPLPQLCASLQFRSRTLRHYIWRVLQSAVFAPAIEKSIQPNPGDKCRRLGVGTF